MAKLGEAYVSIRADLTKFDKDLDVSLKRAVDKFERDLNRQVGKKLGTNVGGGFREGIRESMNGVGKDIDSQLSVPANSSGRRVGRNFKRGVADELQDHSIVTRTLASMVSALEDGFSSLPAEVKAVVGAGLLAVLVPAGALLGAAIGTALIAGIDAAGIALAFQFEEVEARGKAFASTLRVRLVDSAQAFGSAAVNAMDFLDSRLEEIGPTLRSVFDNAAKFVLPFADGISRILDETLQGIDRGLQGAEIEELISSLVRGFEYIGVSIGDAFEILLSNPNLDVALYDLLEAIGDVITLGGDFLNWALDVYDTFRDVTAVVLEFTDRMWSFIQAVDALLSMNDGAEDHLLDFLGLGDDKFIRSITKAEYATANFNKEIRTTIKDTEEEAKALHELQRALDDQTSSARSAISTQIAYQESIRRSRDALKESKGSIDLTTEAGSKAAEEILKRIDLIDRQAQAQIDSGKKTDAEAQKYFEKEIARLRAEFVARGGNIKQFDALYGQYIKLAGLPPIEDPTGPLNLGAKNLKQSFDLARIAWEKALAAFKKKPASGNIKVEGGTQLKGFADGGMITEPSIIAAGEGGRPELILPVTQPDRSMQLLANSPLAGMVGGGTSVVYAFFDGEPFQARMVRTARSVNQQAARTINQGPRNI